MANSLPARCSSDWPRSGWPAASPAPSGSLPRSPPCSIRQSTTFQPRRAHRHWPRSAACAATSRSATAAASSTSPLSRPSRSSSSCPPPCAPRRGLRSPSATPPTWPRPTRSCAPWACAPSSTGRLSGAKSPTDQSVGTLRRLMKLGVPKEAASGEHRVAMVPEVVQRLGRSGVEVVVEPGAGAGARIPDQHYIEAGATIGDPWQADVVVKVAPPTEEEIGRLRQGAVFIGFLQPLTNPEIAEALDKQGVTAFAMESIPRISRAQSMDALSSQANVGGYKAVLIAADHFGRYFPMLMTAAGTVPPAKVLVLGAGVAGLQAIATAKRLGAAVQAFDVRSVVKEQIESLGAKFVKLDLDFDAEAEGGYARQLTDEEQDKQRAALADVISKVDVVITTAQVPGKRAPLLITADAVERMAPGSVIVDLAGDSGGNCELTEPGETVVKHDVTIAAPLNLPGDMPDHASQLYSRNVSSLLELMIGDEGALKLDFDDAVIAGACITRDGEIVHEGAKQAVGAAATS